jgi:hypothetical protein
MQPETTAGQVKVDQWAQVIEYLKSDDSKSVHKWYSRTEGWGYISYKSNRVRIDNTWTLFRVKALVSSLLQETYNSFNIYH